MPPPLQGFFLLQQLEALHALLHGCSTLSSEDKGGQGKSLDLESWSPPYQYPGYKEPCHGRERSEARLWG